MEAGAPILVTGFEAFGEHPVNPSGRVAEALGAEPDVRTAVLPVAYARAEEQLLGLLDQLRPSAVLMFGLHPGSHVALERVALNLDEHASPDADGSVRRDAAIRTEGPTAYWSSLPLRALADALERLGVPWDWSSHAGGFLCNHVFYVARHRAAQRGWELPCGFVHLPPVADLPLATQVIAARACLDALGAGSQAGGPPLV